MNIKEQIKEKENMIEKLKNEIEQLKKDSIQELTKEYQMRVGKYYKLSSYHYIRVNSIKDDEYYYCISAFYKDDAKYMIIEDEYVKYLDELGDAEEITEQEFLNFINGKIMEIIK